MCVCVCMYMHVCICVPVYMFARRCSSTGDTDKHCPVWQYLVAGALNWGLHAYTASTLPAEASPGLGKLLLG